jgi:uncharacterized protein (DUF983 family)
MSLSVHDLPVAPVPKRDVWLSARRGLRLRCPRCGEGRLLSGYLKQVEACGVCGEDYRDIRADDGPAWATILLVGHLCSPLFFVFALKTTLPDWAPLVFVLALVVGSCLAMLPRMKGLFLSLIWAMGAKGETPDPA